MTNDYYQGIRESSSKLKQCRTHTILKLYVWPTFNFHVYHIVILTGVYSSLILKLELQDNTANYKTNGTTVEHDHRMISPNIRKNYIILAEVNRIPCDKFDQL